MIYFRTPKKLKLLMTIANGLIKTMMKWPQGTLYAPVICILVSLCRSPQWTFDAYMSETSRHTHTGTEENKNSHSAFNLCCISQLYSQCVCVFQVLFYSHSVFFLLTSCSVATNYGSNFYPTAMRISILHCSWNRTKRFACTVDGFQV